MLPACVATLSYPSPTACLGEGARGRERRREGGKGGREGERKKGGKGGQEGERRKGGQRMEGGNEGYTNGGKEVDNEESSIVHH